MLIQISLKFIPKDPIDNKLSLDLVQVMAWHQIGNSSSSELMMSIDNDTIFLSLLRP